MSYAGKFKLCIVGVGVQSTLFSSKAEYKPALSICLANRWHLPALTSSVFGRFLQNLFLIDAAGEGMPGADAFLKDEEFSKERENMFLCWLLATSM